MPAPVDINDPFRGLSDPTRRRILRLLAAGPLPVRLIADHFPGISRPAVSKHLRVLREGGLVTEERSGRERYYRMVREMILEAAEWLAQVDRLAGGGGKPTGAARPARPARPARGPKRSARARAAPKRKRDSEQERRSVPEPPAGPLTEGEEGDWKAW